MSTASHGITRGSWCAAIAACAILAGGADRARAAGQLSEWQLPNPTGGPVVLAPAGGGVAFIQETGPTGLQYVGWMGSTLFQWSVPIGNLDSIALNPADGTLFFASSTNHFVGRIDPTSSGIGTQWTLPATFGPGTPTFAFNSTGDLFYASTDAVTGLWIVRFTPSLAAPEVTAWAIPGDIGDATLGDMTGGCAVDSTGRVYFNIKGPAHNMIARLDPATDTLTYWDVAPFAPGRVSVDPKYGVVSFKEQTGLINDRIGVLDPGSSDHLTEWEFDGELGDGGQIASYLYYVAFAAPRPAGTCFLGEIRAVPTAGPLTRPIEGKTWPMQPYTTDLKAEHMEIAAIFAGSSPSPKTTWPYPSYVSGYSGYPCGSFLTYSIKTPPPNVILPWGRQYLVFGEPDQICSMKTELWW